MDLTYASSHFSTISTWSAKWTAVALKLGESSAASFKPAGLFKSTSAYMGQGQEKSYIRLNDLLTACKAVWFCVVVSDILKFVQGYSSAAIHAARQYNIMLFLEKIRIQKQT